MVVISQHPWICLFLRNFSQMYVTCGYFLQNVFQEGPLNHMENNRNKRFLFDALNQYSLSRGSIYTWRNETIVIIFSRTSCLQQKSIHLKTFCGVLKCPISPVWAPSRGGSKGQLIRDDKDTQCQGCNGDQDKCFHRASL